MTLAAQSTSDAILRAEIERRAAVIAWRLFAARVLALLATWLFLGLCLVYIDQATVGGLSRAALLVSSLFWAASLLVAIFLTQRVSFAQRVEPRYVAQQFERESGVAHNAVTNGLLVSDDPSLEHARQTCANDALRAIDAAPPERADRGLLRALGLVGCAAALWVTYAAFSSKPMGPTLARLLGAYKPAPTATSITLVRPTLGERLYVGEPLELEFEIAGRDRGTLRVEVTPASGASGAMNFEVARHNETGPDRRVIALAPSDVSADLRYRATCGDGHLEGFLPARALPRVVKTTVEAQPPAYAGLAATQFVDRDVEALHGSELRLRVEGNAEIYDPIFVLRGTSEARTRMQVDPDDAHRALIRLTPQSDGEFWVEFSDVGGRHTQDSTRHKLRLLGDAAPQITFDNATSDTPIDISKERWLRGAVVDDVQINDVTLVERRANGETRRQDLKNQTGGALRSLDFGVPTSQFDLAVNEVVELWIEASDNFARENGTPAPHVTTSEVLRLTRNAATAEASDHGEPSPGEKVAASEGAKSVSRRGPLRPAEGGTTGQTGAGGEEEQIVGAAPTGEERPADSSDEADGSTVAGANDGELKEGAGEASDVERELETLNREFAQEIAELSNRDTGGAQPDSSDAAAETNGSGGGGAGGATNSDSDDSEKTSPTSSPTQQDDSGNGEMTESESPTATDSIGKGPPPAPTSSSASESGDGESSSAENDDANALAPDPQTPKVADGVGAAAKVEPENAPDNSQEQSNDAAKAEDGKADKSESGEKGDAAGKPDDSPGGSPGPSASDEPYAASEASQPGFEIPTSAVAPSEETMGERGTPATDDAAMDSKGRAELVGLLSRLEREGALEDAALAQLGWTPTRVEQFKKQIERVRSAAARAGMPLTPLEWRNDVELGEAAPQAGNRSADLSSLANAPTKDELSLIAAPPEQRVRGELQDLLDAYYRSIAKRSEAASQPARR